MTKELQYDKEKLEKDISELIRKFIQKHTVKDIVNIEVHTIYAQGYGNMVNEFLKTHTKITIG